MKITSKNLPSLVGKYVKLNDQGCRDGYNQYVGNGKVKLLRVSSNNVYLEVNEMYKQSYPSGYAVPINRIETVPAETIKAITEDNTELYKEIVKLEQQIAENNLKIKFMEVNKLTEFSETDFKVYAVLEVIDDKKTTKLEKARAIAKLVEG